MGLVPIIKSDDPYFNHDAAQWAAELVMKMDEDEARTFTSLVVGDVLEDEIEKNQRTLQRHLNTVVAKRIDVIKKALINTSISKSAADENTLAYAQALAIIEKAAPQNPYERGYRFQESDFRRDPQTGRFMTKIKHRRTTPMKDSEVKSYGIDRGAKKTQERARYEAMSSETKAQYQDEYVQIADFLSGVYTSTKGNPGDTRVLMHVQNKETGDVFVSQPRLGTKAKLGDWDPETERVIGVEALPEGLTVGGAYFGLANSLGADHHAAERNARMINRADQKFSGFADSWTKDTDPKSSNARLFNRVKSGSEFLGAVAPEGSKMQIAAEFGRFVGERGPEAEKVIGPSMRKAGYRYRGTEKRPDQDLIDAYETAVRVENRPVSGGRELSPEDRTGIRRAQNRALTRAREQKAVELNRDSDKLIPIETVTLTPEERKNTMNAAAQEYLKGKEAAGPQGPTLHSGREAVVQHLMDEKRAPDKNLYALHLEAGNTPPSEGVMIDSKGQIRAQAIGYGDDHYLPFNLKNLKHLKGGEYIRTRSVGGPTSEDIYTGLVSGARQFTVASRSGTFVVEFEDDFRGGRRHNDKARRMVRRYEQILDAVQSEKVDRMSVPPKIAQAITAQVKEEMHGMSPREVRAEIKNRMDEYKENPELSEEDELALEAAWARETDNGQAANSDQVRAMLWNEAQKAKEIKYRLNGEGYAAALKTLQEQFPYYIKTRYEPKKEQERIEVERDSGYVEPGRNRPTRAKAGWHGTETNPGKKFSASQADYQRGVYGRAEAKREEGAADTDKESAAGPRSELDEKQRSARKKIAEVKAVNTYKPAATEMQKKLLATLEVSSPDIANRYREREPQIYGSTENFALWVKDPKNAAKFDKYLRDNNFFRANKVFSETEIVQYQKASGRLGREPYSDETKFLEGKPRLFSEKPYDADAPAGLVLQEVKKRNRPAVSAPKMLAEMSEEELAAEVTLLDQIESLAPALKEAGVKGKELRDALVEMGVGPDVRGVDKFLKPEMRSAQIEAVQRMRALKTNENFPSAEKLEEVVDIAPEPRKQGDFEDSQGTKEAQSKLDEYRGAEQYLQDDPAAKAAAKAAADEIEDTLLRTGKPISDAEMEAWRQSPTVKRAEELLRPYKKDRRRP